MGQVTLGQSAVAVVDLVIAQAATNRYKLTYETGDEGYETPVDLTGWTASSQFRKSAAATAILATPAVTLTPTGDVTVTLSPAQTAGWDDVHDGVWDLYLTAPGLTGDVIRLAAGQFVVEHRITR